MHILHTLKCFLPFYLFTLYFLYCFNDTSSMHSLFFLFPCSYAMWKCCLILWESWLSQAPKWKVNLEFRFQQLLIYALLFLHIFEVVVCALFAIPFFFPEILESNRCFIANRVVFRILLCLYKASTSIL